MKAIREEEVKLRGARICETGRYFKPGVKERGSYVYILRQSRWLNTTTVGFDPVMLLVEE